MLWENSSPPESQRKVPDSEAEWSVQQPHWGVGSPGLCLLCGSLEFPPCGFGLPSACIFLFILDSCAFLSHSLLKQQSGDEGWGWGWRVNMTPPSFATMEKRTGPAWCRATWSGPFGDVRTKTWPYPCLWEMDCHSAWKDFSRTGSKEDEQVVGKTWALLPGCFPSSWGLLVVGPSTGRPLEGFLQSRGGLALGMVNGWEQSLEDLKIDPGCCANPCPVTNINHSLGCASFCYSPNLSRYLLHVSNSVGLCGNEERVCGQRWKEP